MMSPEKSPLPVLDSDDLLWKHLKTVPAFRGFLRAIEARFYQQILLPHPILDVGCGDGHFAHVTFEEKIDVGIDPWWGPLQQSKQSQTYDLLLQCLGNELPFPDNHFKSAISNSVLEHIPDIQAVLNETARVLQPNGRFVVTMPCHHFNDYLGGVSFLRRLGANGLAERYLALVTRITRHVHVNPPEIWASRFAEAGLEVERWQYYFSPAAVRALEIGHIQGVPAAIMRALTGHWIIAPWQDSLARIDKWLRPFYEEETAVSEGGYIFMVARKAANQPIDAPLPPLRPFTIAELMQAEQARLARNDHQSSQAIPLPETAVPVLPPIQPQKPPPARRTIQGNMLNYTFLVAGLFLAVIGQMVLTGSPDQPGRGIVWFLLSGLALIIGGGKKVGVSLPTLRFPDVQRWAPKRWLIFGAILISLFVQGRVSGGGVPRPFVALLLWGSAIGLGYWSLAKSPTPQVDAKDRVKNRYQGVRIGLILFMAAFGLRIFNLTEHPFMLSGIEASLGLDALGVIQGSLQNPFGTGWLTNPTLPSFIAALPLRLFGPTTFSARILSPIIGAATVTAIYLFGRKLWDHQVGIVAAILLAGSHFHIHYSRLGMHNIWDPLLTLSALGILTLAWQGDGTTAQNRRLWLLGGGLVGLNAYVFTSARLLPIMLVLLFIFAFWLERPLFRTQFHNMIAASLLAFVVALPIILFYNNNPGFLMERANVVGILANQSGWIVDQVSQTGLSQRELLQQRLWQGLTAFNAGIDRSPSYRAGIPLLSFGTGMFFAVGMIFMLLEFKQQRFRMLLVWVLVTIIFGGVLLLELPNSHRLLIATPALALIAAVALVSYGRLLLNALPDDLGARYGRYLTQTVVVAAILFVVGDVIYYYGRYPNENQFGDPNTEVADRIGHYLADQPNGTAYFLGPPRIFIDFPTITYLAQSYKGSINLFNVAPNETNFPPAQSERQLFIILPERAAELDQIRVQYPNGQLREFSGILATPLFFVYEVDNE